MRILVSRKHIKPWGGCDTTFHSYQSKNRNYEATLGTVQAAPGVMVCGIFSWHTLGYLFQLIMVWRPQLIVSIVAGLVHHFMAKIYPSSNSFFKHKHAPYHKVMSKRVPWVWQWDPWPPQPTDLDPVEHLWVVVPPETHSMNVQLTNLQQLCQHLKETFPTLEFPQRRIKAAQSWWSWGQWAYGMQKS